MPGKTAAKRSDGRIHDEMRALYVIYEGLDRVDGSARFGFGDTKAIASLSGPIEVRLAAEQPSKATFEVNIRPLSNVPGTESKSLSASLRSLFAPSLILSRNPRTLIQLVIQSLTPSPAPRFQYSLIAAFINASTLAILNAGSVPMSGVICAVAIGRLPLPENSATSERALFLDPTDKELLSADGGGCFAFMFASDFGDTGGLVPVCKMVWTNWTATAGVFDEDELLRAKELAKRGAEQVWTKIKASVEYMDRSRPVPLHALAPSQSQEQDVPMAVEEAEDDDAKMEI
ncbi:hypothetical protein EWM64_g3882 [Hericium alpestre]|uniref:Exoribonuclease phosphorolytic domain-containing protein n=1 Tax=Hericium alpestre TaxID=135208 RepID=A0A4Z0A103_9AGAM|nr:hypothetical protein EWM64_g3882 [Hericium alpestre]